VESPEFAEKEPVRRRGVGCLVFACYHDACDILSLDAIYRVAIHDGFCSGVCVRDFCGVAMDHINGSNYTPEIPRCKPGFISSTIGMAWIGD
jgi:hypothetical protein